MIKLHSASPPSARWLRRRSVLAFLGALTVLAALIGIFGWNEFAATTSPADWIEVGTLTVLAIALILLVVEGGVRAAEAGTAARIERGEGVLARWTVDALTWSDFHAQRQALDRRPGAIRTYPRFPAEAPAGVEIIVAEGKVFIGPDFSHPLPPVFALQACLTDGWLELDCLGDLPSHILRLPVPPDALPAVQRFLLALKSSRGSRPDAA